MDEMVIDAPESTPPDVRINSAVPPTKMQS